MPFIQYLPIVYQICVKYGEFKGGYDVATAFKPSLEGQRDTQSKLKKARVLIGLCSWSSGVTKRQSHYMSRSTGRLTEKLTFKLDLEK